MASSKFALQGILLCSAFRTHLKYQASKTISFHSSTEKSRRLYVDDDIMRKVFGLGAKSRSGFFIQKIKMASNMAANKLICNYVVLFGEVSSSSGCLGWAALFYCGTPWAVHITILRS